MIIILSKIVEIIIDAGIAQGFFLAFILATNKNRKGRANSILAILLIILSISILHSTVRHFYLISPSKINEPFILLIGPLLLLYFRELTGLRRLNRYDILHLIPFILFFLLVLPKIIFDTDSLFGLNIYQNEIVFSICVWAFIVIQYSFYWWVVVRLFLKHKAAVESEFSNTEGKTLLWMKSFFHILGASLILLVISIPIAFHFGNFPFVVGFINCILSITVFILGYEGLFQEEVFSNAITVQSVTAKRDQLNVVSENQQVVEVGKEEIKKLLNHVEQNKPYLNENLTLTELANQLGMTRNRLSLVINNGVGHSFFSFINKYRVEEVKRLIVDPKNKNFTILSLAYEAGFPSKSAFHSNFKIVTGLTPTEYRNTL